MSISDEIDNLGKYRSNLKENINEAYANDYIQRLYNVWNYAGRPKISTKPSLLGSIFIPKYYDRATYNPVTNTITIPKEDQNVLDYDILKKTISELAHPIQFKIQKPNKIHTIIDALRSIEEIFGKQNRYYDKQHFEYQTHQVIEPQLKNYIYNNKPFPLNNENNTQ